MSNKDTLPPLPEPFGLFCGVRHSPPNTTEFWGMLTTRDTGGNKCNLYTSDQMRTYAAACILDAHARGAIAAQAPTAQDNGIPEGYKLLDDGKTMLALVVCDLLGLHRSVSVEARRLIQEATGIPPERVLISATSFSASAKGSALTPVTRFSSRASAPLNMRPVMVSSLA